MSQWLKMVLTIDAVAIVLLLIVLSVLSQWMDSWSIFSYDFTDAVIGSSIKLGIVILGLAFVHFTARGFTARVIANKIVSKIVVDKKLAGKHREGRTLAGNVKQAFLKNTQPLRSMFRPMPVGWSMRSKRILAEVTADASEFIQTMNDRFTRPSGDKPQHVIEQAEQSATAENVETVAPEAH